VKGTRPKASYPPPISLIPEPNVGMRYNISSVTSESRGIQQEKTSQSCFPWVNSEKLSNNAQQGAPWREATINPVTGHPSRVVLEGQMNGYERRN